MKYKRLLCILAVTTLAGLVVPIRMVTQNGGARHHSTHHHYQLIDVGTFGGPSSYFDALSLSDRFGFTLPIFEFAPVLNKRGILAGWADTSTPDPFSPLCLNPDCYNSHAFQWRDGSKIDLGVLPGGGSSAALWINSHGLTVGMSQTGGVDSLTGLPVLHSVLWRNGQIRDLGTFGGSMGYAAAVNDHGKVVGTTQNSVPDSFSFFDLLFAGSPNGSQTRAFLWDDDGGLHDLGTLGGPDAGAFLVNNRGQVAGMSYTDAIPNQTTGIPTLHPFLWDKEHGMQDLGTVGGTSLGSVNGLNERGQVVGATTTAGDVWLHPFLWDGKKMIDLSAPPFGGAGNGEADWINEAGDIVGLGELGRYCPPGSAVMQPMQHAFLWRHGAIIDLGSLPGNPNSEADFINERRQVVGTVWDCNYNFTAFLWENGSMIDLNRLISRPSQFYLFSAPFIADDGKIAAFGGLANGAMHAVLLIPCDDEHPRLEDCDYSEVDGDALAQSTAWPAAAPGAWPTRPTAAWRRSNVIHLPTIGARN